MAFDTKAQSPIVSHSEVLEWFSAKWRNGLHPCLSPGEGYAVDDVITLQVNGEPWVYYRIQTPAGTVVVRRGPNGELLDGTFGSTEDEHYKAMERPFREWTEAHPGASLDEKAQALARLYEKVRGKACAMPPIAVAADCPACGASMGAENGAALCGCSRCGLLWRGYRSPEAVANVYTGEDGAYFCRLTAGQTQGAHGYEFYEEWLRVILGMPYLEGRARLVEEMAGRTSGRLLEVGCATGEVLSFFQNQGWCTTGVDLSPFCVRTAQARYGLKVQQGDLASAGFGSASFDVVLYMDVFEHIANPNTELAEIARVLTPGGALVLELPNQASLDAAILQGDYLFDEHLFFYTPTAIQALLERHGFVLTQLRTLHDSYYRVQRFLTPTEAEEVVRRRRGERLLLAARRG